ncbi:MULTISPECIES: hypothetical protein [Streptomyces]|nr:hypothetical protein [Streptomyces venezuelae]
MARPGMALGAARWMMDAATKLSAVELRLRQLAWAAEVPATPVELAAVINSLRSTASTVREHVDRMGLLARILDGDVPLATIFPTGDPWGVAARASERIDFGGPAIVPTVWQLIKPCSRDLSACSTGGSSGTGGRPPSTCADAGPESLRQCSDGMMSVPYASMVASRLSCML